LEHTFNDIEDFLTDESFRNWVNSPTPELDAHWKSWMEANQTKIDLVNASRKMIQSLNFKEFQPDSVSKERILQKIRLKTTPKRKYLDIPECQVQSCGYTDCCFWYWRTAAFQCC
jgi:hypothetical protein